MNGGTMKKIIVIGCPGSGKTTFSLALHEKTGIPLHHLDMMFWNADKTTVEKRVFLERLSRVLKTAAWILDGNYASTMEMRLSVCDTVFLLDYPTDVCLGGVKKRRGKARCDMPWIETEEDTEFVKFITGFHEKVRPEILTLLDRYREKNIIVFKSREESSNFLKGEYKHGTFNG